jgi:4-diphosphocytidyl-2-C-methyl-D-erythritol kinase
MLYLPAYAKLNLTLEVLGARPDGYHEISTVMQTIALYDLVGLERADSTSLAVSGLGITGGAENLVLLAHEAVEHVVERSLPVRVHLHKRIPVGAGLGGGSADAAVTIRGLNSLFELNLPGTARHACAAAVGADVPFLLQGGTAWATGRGEHLEALPDVPAGWVVLAVPPIQVGTAGVYEAAGNTPLSDGGRSAALVRQLRSGLPLTAEALHNDLQRVTLREEPGVAEGPARLPPGFLMTGTGGAFYAWCQSRREAEALRARLSGIESLVCATMPRREP